MAETFSRIGDLAPVVSVMVLPTTGTMQYVGDLAPVLTGDAQDIPRNARRSVWISDDTPQDGG